MIKAVLFDYGGVLSAGRHVTHDLAMAADLPLDQIDVADLHGQLCTDDISTKAFFEAFNRRHKTNITIEQFIIASEDIFEKAPEVYNLAQKLEDKGIKTGILSNIYKVIADEIRKRGLYDGFGPIILSCSEGIMKPNKEIYQRAISELGYSPNEILFIDDQEKCLPPARDLGMYVIKADSEAQIVADTKALLKEQNGLEL
ncbi:MAG: HAD-IA family hydrolase [Candidatus Saccharimonadales bacterium]